MNVYFLCFITVASLLISNTLDKILVVLIEISGKL